MILHLREARVDARIEKRLLDRMPVLLLCMVNEDGAVRAMVVVVEIDISLDLAVVGQYLLKNSTGRYPWKPKRRSPQAPPGGTRKS